MGGIDKVGGGQRAFSQDELEAMRSESTSTIANKAREIIVAFLPTMIAWTLTCFHLRANHR